MPFKDAAAQPCRFYDAATQASRAADDAAPRATRRYYDMAFAAEMPIYAMRTFYDAMIRGSRTPAIMPFCPPQPRSLMICRRLHDGIYDA